MSGIACSGQDQHCPFPLLLYCPTLSGTFLLTIILLINIIKSTVRRIKRHARASHGTLQAWYVIERSCNVRTPRLFMLGAREQPYAARQQGQQPAKQGSGSATFGGAQPAEEPGQGSCSERRGLKLLRLLPPHRQLSSRPTLRGTFLFY